MNYDNKPKHISIMGSTAHTYGNALAFIQNWLINLFPENYFKTIHVASKIAHRQIRSTPHEYNKKSKPIFAIRPRIDLTEDRHLAKTMITERQSDLFYMRGGTNLQPFIEDYQHNYDCRFQLNRYVMYFDVTLIFSTYIEQVNFTHALINSVPIDRGIDLHTCLESCIPTDLLEEISILTGIPIVDKDGNTAEFLNYLNGVSHYPITYKLQGSSGTREFYRYYPAVIDVLVSPPDMSEGNKQGQINTSYQTTFTVRAEFFGTGFYFLYSEHCVLIPPKEYSDSTTIVPMFTTALLSEDLKLPEGWKLYKQLSCQLTKQRDVIEFREVLNQSIINAIDYHVKNGLPMVDLIDIKVRKQGKLLIDEVEYHIDYENNRILFDVYDYDYYTFTIIISINIRYINELIKTVFNLK